MRNPAVWLRVLALLRQSALADDPLLPDADFLGRQGRAVGDVNDGDICHETPGNPSSGEIDEDVARLLPADVLGNLVRLIAALHPALPKELDQAVDEAVVPPLGGTRVKLLAARRMMAMRIKESTTGADSASTGNGGNGETKNEASEDYIERLGKSVVHG